MPLIQPTSYILHIKPCILHLTPSWCAHAAHPARILHHISHLTLYILHPIGALVLLTSSRLMSDVLRISYILQVRSCCSSGPRVASYHLHITSYISYFTSYTSHLSGADAAHPACILDLGILHLTSYASRHTSYVLHITSYRCTRAAHLAHILYLTM